MRDIVLVTGGARSGKSRLAESWALASPKPVWYVATCEARRGDLEMAERIAAHAARRPVDWVTKEEPLALPELLASAPPGGTVLVDCLTLWAANLLGEGGAGALDRIARETARLAGALNREGRTLLVANEVGMGIVPDNALARQFRDAAGAMAVSLGAVADRVVLCVAGLPLVVKGSSQGVPFLGKAGGA